MNNFNTAVEQALAEQDRKTKAIVKLGKVTTVSNKRARVTFYGEGSASAKDYPYIVGYYPEVDDVVALLPQGDTYIILGKVSNDTPSPQNTYASKESVDNIINGTTKVGKATTADSAATADSATTATSASTADSATTAATATKANSATTADSTGKLAYNSTNYIYMPSASEVRPSGSNTDLGSNGHAFKNIYASTWHTPTSSSYGITMVDQMSGNQRAVAYPSASGSTSLGTSSNYFYNLYGRNIYQNGSAVSTSDRRLKNTITDLTERFKSFFRKLRPVTFKFNDGESGRLHAGFIAQEVEEAMHECGIKNDEFAGLVIQESGEYGLRYEEFIAIQTAVIQELEARVTELERRLNDCIDSNTEN